MIVNSEAYRKLVREDIEWLLRQPRTLERNHIRQILEHQIRDAEEIVSRDREREKHEETEFVLRGVIAVLAEQLALYSGSKPSHEVRNAIRFVTGKRTDGETV